MIFLIISLCILLIICSVLFYITYKSLNLISKYEDFYTSTVEDISIISQTIDTILNRRVILSEDPDIQSIVRGLKILRQIISEYSELKTTNNERKEEETSRQEIQGSN